MSDFNERFRQVRADVDATRNVAIHDALQFRAGCEKLASVKKEVERARARTYESRLAFFRACLKLEAFESETPFCSVCGKDLTKAARRPRKTCSRSCLGRRSNLLAKEKQP